ncbi:all4928 [Nostoc sp. PCC 7120 = FACHB-418]|nr:all4928 [Nostoc sp. PCC 7120 = FACHB-418]
MITFFYFLWLVEILIAGFVMNPNTASTFNVGILKGVQILIVDNDIDSGVLYTLLLKDVGATVITTNSIKEALKILIRFVPHIVICEIRFLGESIYILLNKLMAMEAGSRNHIPIIVTSTCIKGTIEEIPEIEFEGYLIKPIDLDKLIVLIQNLLPFGSNHLFTDVLQHSFINDMVVADSSLTGMQISSLNKDHE